MNATNISTATYGDLLTYVDENLDWCDDSLRTVEQFAQQYDVNFEKLADNLTGLGGYCDCLVLLNVFDGYRIELDEVIGQETFVTPEQYAIDHELYACCLIDGESVDYDQALAARAACQPNVQFHVPCNKHAPYAYIDLNRAYKDLLVQG